MSDISIERALGEAEDSFYTAFLDTHGDDFKWALRAPRDLVLATWEAINIVGHLQAAVKTIYRIIKDAVIPLEESVKSRDEFSHAILFLFYLEFRNTREIQASEEFRTALYNCIEYIEAVSGDPVLFCGEYYTSFYILSEASVSCHSTIVDFLDLSGGNWLFEYCMTNPWKKYPSPPDNWYETVEGQLTCPMSTRSPPPMYPKNNVQKPFGKSTEIYGSLRARSRFSFALTV